MANTYSYRYRKSSWGIAVDLTAEAITGTTDAQPIAKNIYLCFDAPIGLTEEEHRYLAQGLRLCADQLQHFATDTLPLVVRVIDVKFNDCDYQAEGLVCAMAGWAAQEFGFTMPTISVHFDRQNNRYQFDFPQMDIS